VIGKGKREMENSTRVSESRGIKWWFYIFQKMHISQDKVDIHP
jgi:hypothetical protein